uniref:microsomal glutathione S-transferase 1-like n=1 Tax=Styela clava TaxID=7725 RepID=UPI001939F33B|nr:microsomal glutathione S-transferase 1-like [Styela clava]
MAATSLFVMENKVFSAYLFYCALILLKLLIMSPITITYRMLTNSFMNIEDTRAPVLGTRDPDKQKRALVPNESVNRVRRAHQNDIECIVPFTILGMLYVAIKPDFATAEFVFKVFAGARIAHTPIYILGVPQPARFVAFLVGFAVNMYMAMQVIMASKPELFH